MPFTESGRLLARSAALLLLGAACAGCQSNPVVRSCMPGGVPVGSPQPAYPVADSGRIIPVAAVGEPTLGPPAICTNQGVVQAVVTPGTGGPVTAPRAQPATPAQGGGCATCNFFPTPPGRPSLLAVFRRPSAQEPPRLPPTLAQPMVCQDGHCTSAVMLRPVPVGGAPVDGGFHAAQPVEGTVQASHPVAFVPATRPADPPLAELPGAGEGNVSKGAAPPPARPELLGPPKTPNDAAKNGTLPPPRVAKTPKPLPGYPELPSPTVTHPPAAPREFAKRALSAYIIEPPDVLQIDLSPAVGDKNFPIRGTHLVRPDGTVGLGPVGSVFVAGLTLDQAKYRIGVALAETYYDRTKKDYPERFAKLLEGLKVDVTSYNSKFYYVIADGGGYGEQVYRILCTGNETILDAIAQVEGLPRVASKSKIWIARATPTEVHHPQILPVDWIAVTQLGSAATNYQVYPGDRIYVNSDVRIRVDSHLAKFISPIERLFGITLLGSTTVNSIKGRNNQ